MARITEYQSKISDKMRCRLLELIEESGCTKWDFAAKVGVNKEVISKATVYGIIPAVKSLIKISDSLCVSIDYILGETADTDFEPSNEHSDFYTRFDNLLEEKKIKYCVMADSMPFQKNSYYEWKRNKCLPTLDFLRAIAAYFEVSIDYLLGRTDYRY
ncbi:MAG: hypothetical protein K2I79_00015 [Clostridia bacterium]|nr:hypothetical protein [Clostridia bacterium]